MSEGVPPHTACSVPSGSFATDFGKDRLRKRYQEWGSFAWLLETYKKDGTFCHICGQGSDKKPLTIAILSALWAFSLQRSKRWWLSGKVRKRGRTRRYHKTQGGDGLWFQGTVSMCLWAFCRFYYRRAQALQQGCSSLPMEVRNTRAVALETSVTAFNDLCLYNVVLTIKDPEGCEWEYICVCISLNSI